MSSQRPVYIPRRRKAAQSSNSSDSNNNNNNTDPTSASKSTGLDYQTRRERQKQQQPRFHGAFTGGFSAGYFNTVGTKEGWTPSEVKNKDQRLEDFMDDEDHASWGGPTRVRDEYGAKNKVAATPAALTETSMKDHHDSDPTTTSGDDVASSLQQSSSRTPFLPVTYMLEISHQTVGPRLLRRLGWREGGIAIVPENETTSTSNNPAAAGTANDDDVNKNTLENLAKVHLSRRKLRKIQVRSSRIKLPTPKLDQCGLGFEPYKNAPEFQRYRDKRKQQARDRASYNTKVNVYRISDVAAAPVESNTNSHGAAGRLAASSQDNNGGEYLSYETAEDFVGKRSSAGFALRDDEDDAYDDDVIYNHSKQLGRINDGEPQSSRPSTFKVGDEYNTEVYEHESSDDDEYNISTVGLTSNSLSSISRGGVDKHDQSLASANNSKTTATNNKNKSVDVGNMFAAWAGIDQSSREGKASSTLNDAAVTSDGQPPLAGFVLGNCVDKNNQRYSGPDIPRDYTIQRHKFGEHENPYVLEAISNAVRLEQKEERNSQIRQQQQLQQQLQLHQESQRQIMQHRGDESSSRPLSKNFSSLGEAMKRRFTASSTGEGSKKGESSTTKISTTLPTGLHLPRPVENKDNSSKDIKSLHSNVTITRTVKSFFPNPLICKRFRVPVPTNVKRNAGLIATIEEKKNKESAYFQREILGKSKQQQENKKRSVQNMDDTGNAKSDETQTNEEEAPKRIDRPAIENLRSIFQPSSDESSSSSDDDESDDGGEKTSIDLDQSQKDDSNYSKEDKQSPALSSEGSPAKDGLGGGSREIVEYRPSLSQDELENFSSRSSGSDDEYLSSRKRRKEKRRRKHRHHSRKRHKRKSSRSIDRDGDSDRSSSHEETEDEKQRKEHRSREHKRRKKKKSSRHKSRKREKCESK
jgi:G patch domain-containing protein 1